MHPAQTFSDEGQSKQASAVNDEVDRLDRLSETLEKSVAVLSEQLSPLKRPDAPTPDLAELAQARGPVSPLAERLASHNDRLDRLVRRLERIGGLLDL